MGILSPAYSQYSESADAMKEFFDTYDLEYCMYGSFVIPEKVKPGLSDIDIMVVHKGGAVLFPIGITKVFGKIKDHINSLGIPLQISWTTTAQLNNSFLSPDGNYLDEVARGIGGKYASHGFDPILSQVNLRDRRLDDTHMARYFFRKITELGSNIHTTSAILLKSENDITAEDQKKLWSLWDIFKKMISFLAITMRIRDGVSHFSRPNDEIVSLFRSSYHTHGVDIGEYQKILKSIENIGDWFYYLQNGGLERIEYCHETVFTPLIQAVGENR